MENIKVNERFFVKLNFRDPKDFRYDYRKNVRQISPTS